jgi:3-oxoacyl-[acyl-carrier-protein] synthase-3
MQPYLSDPFRGAKERRTLLPDQTSLSLEIEASRNALAAAKMSVNDIDAMIVTSFLPDRVGAGNAAYLAKELGTRCPAWNIESACSSGIVALEVSNALIQAGRYANILVVQSCNYAQTVKDDDPTSWFVGDGAGAMVVSRASEGFGFLSFKVEPTTETCGVVTYRVNNQREEGEPCFVLESIKGAGKILQQSSQPHLVSCCKFAADRANVDLQKIDFFIFSNPTAWYPAFGARALQIPLDRTISTHEKYGNCGPAMMPATLLSGLEQGKIKSGDLVLMYQIGSVSNAAATVMKVEDIAIASSEI